jgi:drug/metabolite transporter (DMT)-like permease
VLFGDTAGWNRGTIVIVPRLTVKDARKFPEAAEALSSLPVAITADSNDVTSVAPIAAHATVLPPLTERETAVEAMKFCFLWFLANYFSNAALQFTNVPSFTIISSMSGFFTLFIGVSVGVENFTWIKLGALFTSYIPLRGL